jgi:hypothetical protein
LSLAKAVDVQQQFFKNTIFHLITQVNLNYKKQRQPTLKLDLTTFIAQHSPDAVYTTVSANIAQTVRQSKQSSAHFDLEAIGTGLQTLD